MIKINKILTVFVFLFAFSATTNAQTSNKNFDGFSIEVGVANQIQSNGNVNQDYYYQGVLENSYTIDPLGGASNTIPRVAINYDIQPFNKFAIGFGGSYLFGESNDINNDDAIKMTIKNAMSVYVAPTFLVSDTTGIYGKISYNLANGKFYDEDKNDSQFIMGYGYGFGIKSFITKNLYLLAEVERINYGKETYNIFDFDDENYIYSINTKVTNATISLGAKF
jgi:opacity protein-like surface antigen